MIGSRCDLVISNLSYRYVHKFKKNKSALARSKFATGFVSLLLLICIKCNLSVSDLLLPTQLRGGARRRDGCGGWSPRRWSPCRRGRPRRSSARHCATVSFSAKCSTALILAPSPRCVSDAYRIWGQNITIHPVHGNWNTTATCQCLVFFFSSFCG